jgi:Restriction endonuclease
MEPSGQSKHAINTLVKLSVIWVVLICPSLFAESEIMTFIGKDRAHVVKQWGPAYTTAYTSDREILTYPQGRIFLSNGIVIEVGAPLTSTSAAGKLPRYSQTDKTAPAKRPTQTPTVQTNVAPPRPTVPVTTITPRPYPSTSQPLSTSTRETAGANQQPSPYDEPPNPLGSVTKTLFNAAIILALLGGVMVGLKIWAEKFVARRRDPFMPTGVFPTVEKHPSNTGGVFPSRSTAPIRTQLDTKLLDELDWLLFEDLTAELFRQEGYRADLSRMGADGGVDIYLHRAGEPRPFAYVQCKAWGSQLIGVEPMRALYGVMASAGIKEGYFVCIGEFSSDARAFAQSNNIQLITGELFVARFNRLPESERTRILTRITQGDYTTPSCAKCGTKMVVKDFSGRGNWCCPRYPKCRSKPIAVRKQNVV